MSKSGSLVFPLTIEQEKYLANKMLDRSYLKRSLIGWDNFVEFHASIGGLCIRIEWEDYLEYCRLTEDIKYE